MRFAFRVPLALVIALGAAGCGRSRDLSAPAYARAVGTFYTGVAAAQVGESGVATEALREFTALAPGEPAGWANLGVVALQRGQLGEAAARLDQARALAPEDSRIEFTSAIVARERGRLDAAKEHLHRAVELDPQSLRALHLLAQIVEQEGLPGSLVEAQQLMDRILAIEPENVAVLLERARLAAKGGDAAMLRQMLDRVEQRAPRGAAVTTALRAARSAADGDPSRAAAELAFLRWELQQLPGYREDQDALRTSPSRADLLLTRFLRLPAPSADPAPPDTDLAFVPESLWVGGAPVAWVRALWLGDAVPLALIAADERTVWISTARAQAEAFAFAGAAPAVAAFDYDYDFRIDLALAGRGGVRLLRQDGIGSFSDVTAEALPSAAARGAYAGAWAADLEMDGDLDLVLARVEGPPVVLRNRGDGTFEPRPGFERVSRLRDFAWADLDADGDPDAVLLDADGAVHVFVNQRYRLPQFEARPWPDTLIRVRAIAVADLNQDAALDLILLREDGSLMRLSVDGEGWEAATIASWPGFFPAGAVSARLFVTDLDNNGALDLVASGPEAAHVWLSAGQRLAAHGLVDVGITELADLGGAGRVDLIGVSRDGAAWRLANQGARDYASVSIRPQAAAATGDRRINPFGIGGEIEIRSGLLYQKQVIQSPTVHVGLGEHTQVDVARIVWPNGSVQAEFNLSATNRDVVARQRLKGSCPWVFAFDGEEFRFVTDFLWRTALGLRINAQGEAAVIHGEDWIRIAGNQLAARDGFYDVRITAELWETHFFDQVALMVVDHPVGTEVFVDERFVLPAPTPTIHAMGPLRPVAGAWDHEGRDVSERIRMLDGRFADGFALGSYQGIAADHYVEVALGEDVPSTGPLWLVASGWVYPTDASINVAVSQGDHPRPRGIRLEVPDGQGAWTVVEPDLGFPSGKTKTLLIGLEHAFRPGAARRVRLSTNMEVYWDRIAWAVGQPDAPLTTHRLIPATAELRYRGFSEVRQADRRAPELPDYHTIAAAAPVWRDLEGYYTRFGDVRPLSRAVDDRYIIMNAGDELALRFAAVPPPRDGWTRDFVLIGDGWVKDGDYNTAFSNTVRPLPYHGLTEYARPPGRLQDDPAYRRHPEDWSVFHTRYVTSRDFHRALVPQRDD